MARKANAFSENDIERLRLALTHKIGASSTKDINCADLAKQIVTAVGTTISIQTIRRFTCQIKDASSGPSVYTLNVIAVFCAYKDFNHFISQTHLGEGFNPVTLDQEKEIYLNVFRIDLKDEQDGNYHNAVKSIVERILSSKTLYDAVTPTLASLQAGQLFFFERFPFMDGLGKGFDRAFEFYLQNKKTNDAQIFGNGILIYKSFLTNNLNDVIFYHSRLQNLQLQENFHPFVFARKLGSQLLFYYSIGDNEKLEHTIGKALELATDLKDEQFGIWKFPHFQFMIADYFLLIRRYDLVFKVLKPIIRQKDFEKDIIVQDGYTEALLLIYWRSYFEIRPNENKFTDVNQKIPTTFNFSFQLYFSIHRKIMELKNTPVTQHVKREKIKNHALALIEKTGFTYFLSDLN